MKVNIDKFVAAIQTVAPFTLPEMSEGTKYLYDGLYKCLLAGKVAFLLDIDFDAFDSEDINSLADMYENIFEKSNCKASNLVNTLNRISPVCKVTAYV